MKKIYSSILAILLTAFQYAYADRNSAIYAYLQGDYESAFNSMISLAKTAEDDIAQYYIGVMYMEGQGIEQDYTLAGEWLRKASEQGLTAAMYRLAQLYAGGLGVPKDLEFAYIWYSVAAAHQHKKSIDAITRVKGRLSEEQLLSAAPLIDKYVNEYVPQYSKQKTNDKQEQ